MIDQHPINNILETSMEKIKEMVDVNTIIGDPFETFDGTTVIPVSKVSFGLASGGAEYSGTVTVKDSDIAPMTKYPFGGGSGAGVSITPIAFIVANSCEVKVLPLSPANVTERLVDLIPTVIDKMAEIFDPSKKSN